MSRYIVRRLVGVAATLIVVSLFTFLLFYVGPGVNTVIRLTCGKECPPEQFANIKRNLELNLPVLQQYWNFIRGIFMGRTVGPAQLPCPRPCMGYSFRQGVPVTTLLVQAFPITLSIAVGAAILWLVGGVSLGIVAALRRGRWPDVAATSLSLVGVSLPTFFFGYLLIFVFCAKLAWLPFPTFVPLTQNPAGWLENLILPWVTLALVSAALYTRLTRANLIETMGEDYIRTARAKGLKSRTVVVKHGLRAALTPIMTILAWTSGLLLGGAIVVEDVFGYNGLGKLTLDSINDFDLPVIAGVTLLAAFFIVMANLLVDVLYAFVDPKVRLS